MLYDLEYCSEAMCRGRGGGSDQAMLGNGDRQPSFSGNPEKREPLTVMGDSKVVKVVGSDRFLQVGAPRL